MVVTDCPSACTARLVHDLVATPSTRTVQDPHWLVSQPTLVPVSRATSRMKCTSNKRGSTSRAYERPLIVMLTATFMVRPPREAGWSAAGHNHIDAHTSGSSDLAGAGTSSRAGPAAAGCTCLEFPASIQ